MRTTSIVAALLGLASSTYAQQVSASQDGITYAVSVPDTTAASGSGDMYFQISGPTSFSYIALGSGSRMSGSHMLIIYTNAAGTNVTLSPRTASGQSQPSFDSSAQAFLVEGSGVQNNVMTAIIRCSSCAGNFDITSSSASLIYAAHEGSAINDDSTSANIQQHSGVFGSMTLDMTVARNTANNNPFVAADGTAATPTTGGGSSGGAQSCVPISQVAGASGTGTATAGSTGTATSATAGASSSAGGRPSWATGAPSWFNDNDKKAKRQEAPNSCPSGFVLSGGSNSGASFNNNGASFDSRTNMLMAHGIMAGLAFAVFFPFGAISIRLLSFPGLLWFHAAFQVFAFIFYIIAFGLGVYLANQMEQLNHHHPVIGMILLVAVFFMPIFGQWHHLNFKKYHKRTVPSYLHLWIGRSLIPLGIINGGLGLQWADNSSYGPIVYGVVAALMFCIYLVAIVIGERRRARNMRQPPKYDEVLLQDNNHDHADHHNRNASPGGSPPRHREFYSDRQK